MSIKDRNVSEAIDIIASEFEEMESLNHQLNEENETLSRECESLTDEIQELKQYITELEEALAQAVLTDIPPETNS